MTALLLTAIEARLAAVPAKWKDAGDWFHDCRVGCNMTEQGEFDDGASELIAHAPTDLAKLLAIVKCYEAALSVIGGCQLSGCAMADARRDVAAGALAQASALAGE